MQKSLDNDELHELEDPGDGDGPDNQDLESEGDEEVVKPPDSTTTAEDDEVTEDVRDDMKADLGLLVVGGTDDEGRPLRHVDLITETGVCRAHGLPGLPAGRHGGVAGLVAGGRRLLVCGGLQEDGRVSGQCWQLSWNISHWTSAPPLIHPTAFAAQVRLEHSHILTF